MAYTTIKKPSDYFNTVLYTGNGGSSQAITGLDFSPDVTWIKQRSSTEQHTIWDTVRGGANRLMVDSTGAEYNNSTQGMQSFDSNGFTVGQNNQTNASSNTYVGWSWLGANGTASNTDGSITSTVSANTTSGFSIVSYTGNGTSGATVGHGLGSAPKMFIVKDRTTAYPWRCWHYGLDNGAGTHEIYLNTTASSGASLDAWNNTAPTSSVFSLGNGNYSNGSGDSYIAYCFAEKKGFSKFGSYTGNGSTDGTFVYTGFKPAFIMVKDYTTAGNNWFIWDNKRDGYNILNRYLRPNLSDAEGNYDAIDILSNGFKNRNTSGSANGSGTGYIYMAFAEEPLVGDNPATAR